MKRWVALVGAVATLFASGCGTPEAQIPAASESPKATFWELMNQQDLEYQQFPTLKEAWLASDVALLGRMVKVVDGRGIAGKKSDPGTVRTALVKFKVDEVVRGNLKNDSRHEVDLELFRPYLVSAEALEDVRPTEQMIVLIIDIAEEPKPDKVDESGVQRDPNKSLYTVTTTKTLFIEAGADIITPLDPTPEPFDESIESSTLKELKEEIRNL